MSRKRNAPQRYEFGARASVEVTPPARTMAGRGGPFTPLHELDLMISLGYGDVPQTHLPTDWKTKKRSYSEPNAERGNL